MSSERRAIAAPLRGCVMAAKSARLAARQAMTMITSERANSTSGTGRSRTRYLTIASCRLKAAQPPMARAAPDIERLAEATAADMEAWAGVGRTFRVRQGRAD